MRTLYVTEHWPWPSRNGGRLRAAATVRALAEFGDVDLLHLDQGWRYSWAEESSHLVGAAFSITPGDDEPFPGFGGDYPPSAAETHRAFGGQVREWLDCHDYDVIWLNRITTWPALPSERQCPVVIDVDDLEDRLILQGIGHEGNSRTFTPIHEAAADPALAAQAAQWRRLQQDAAEDAQWLVFSSELDAARAGFRHSSVVPNVYLDTSPSAPLDTLDTLDTLDPNPRILLTGIFDYPPNADAARRLVTGILPLVRQQIPGACVWLVGQDLLGALSDLASPHVRLVGPVPDVKPYVRAADVVAVPLRQGSGTRLKIIEAFALGTPVVSTALGAEGLALVSGEHLLQAESDAELADAIFRVHREPALGGRLVTAARKRYESGHTLPALLEAVGAVLESIRIPV